MTSNTNHHPAPVSIAGNTNEGDDHQDNLPGAVRVRRPACLLDHLAGWLHVPAPVFWALLPFLLYMADRSLTLKVIGSHPLSSPLVAWAFFSAACSLNALWSLANLQSSETALQRSLDIPVDAFHTWYAKRLRWMTSSPAAITIIVAVMVLFNVTVFCIHYRFTGEGAALALVRVVLFSLSVLGPSCLWAIVVGTCLMGHRLVELPIRVSYCPHPKKRPHTLGLMFFRLTLATVGCFAVGLVVLGLSPVARSPAGFVWAAVTALAILLGFVVPQVGVHRIMAAEKRRRLGLLSTHIEKALDRVLANPCPESLARFKDLCEVLDRVENTSEWPFNAGTLWQLTTAIGVPLLLHFIEVLWQ